MAGIKIDEKLKLYWKNYIFQSLFATLVIFILFLVLSMRQAVIVASVGASAFIVFAMPRDITAKGRNIIGGHLVGIVSGALFALIPRYTYIHSIVACSLAVGLSIFIMVITDTEHPPASGTALGIALEGSSLDVVLTVMVSAVMLSLVHRFFGRYLKNLV